MKYSHINYVLVAVVSVVVLLFLPFLGSDIGLGFTVPTTAAGWTVYVMTKLIAATVNVLLFHCFLSQGKVNVKEDPRFIQANELMRKSSQARRQKPISPKEWLAKEYTGKGITIFITTLLSSFCLAHAVLTFDFITFITYLFTIGSGIIFGILEMKKAEEFWTDGYYEYAVYMAENTLSTMEEITNGDT